MPLSAPLPLDEAARLTVLDELCLLDSPPDPTLDAVAALATRMMGTEIALISMVDVHRQWFKARIGLEVPETPRDQSFCAYTLRDGEFLTVPDATRDPRFRDNPLVTGPPHIRFYAGAPLRLGNGHCIGTLCVIGLQPRDGITPGEQEQLEALRDLVVLRIENLRSDGYRDALTALPNRARFGEDLALWLSEHRPGQLDVAVAVDVCGGDYFRDMVKALGWEYAEGYIVAAKQRLLQCLEGLTLYRVDTSSFAFVLRNPSEELLAGRCQAVARAFATAIDHQGIPHAATISIGSVGLDHSYSVTDTLRSLTTAVDRARQQGQCWSRYERRHDAAQRNAFRLLAALPEALESQQQLRLHYQPRVNLHDDRCVAVEALLRWEHPLYGAIPPGEFIPLAEQSALMSRITAWVLDRALAQAALWQQAGRALIIAINVSATDLDQPDFAGVLQACLQRYATDPGRIEIEFTESAMIRHPDRLAEQLQAVHALGVRIAIDDFGTGYSNFTYLKKLPARALKIDQSFIRSLPDNRTDSTIAPALIRLGHDLDLRVVAEGVESEAAYALLREWGCDEAQGYWIARPMPSEDLERWLAVPWRLR